MPHPQLLKAPDDAVTIADGAPTKTNRLMAEVFAGSGRLTKAFRAKGWDVLPVDVETNDVVTMSTDLTQADQQERLCAILRSAGAEFVHIGTPCASFSRARRLDGGPPP